MQLDYLNVLAAFLAVAEERSFTKAATRLGVSRSALSHAVRGLEERLGVRLLARTTRSVAPTEAGEQLIARLKPALGEVESVLDQIVELREHPTGRVRLLVTPMSATMVLAPKLLEFGRRFADVLRGAPAAELSTRFAGAPMHQSARRLRGTLSLGVREGR